MKNRFFLVLFLMIIGVFAIESATAQESRLPELDGTKESTYTEIYPESENKALQPVAISRDSVQSKPATLRKPDNKAKDENNSVLSFNFLFYLIERYKLSDIVD